MKQLKAAGTILVFALMALMPGRAAAQQVTNPSWLLSVNNSPTQVSVGGTITYTLFISNRVTMPGLVFITNQFSGPFTFVSSTNSINVSLIGTNVSGANAYVFQYIGAPYSSTFITNTITLRVQPTTSGVFTNIVSVGEENVLSNAAFVSNTTTVTNSTATLLAGLSFPSFPILANDWVTYTASISNQSSTSASRLTLSNLIPAGANVVTFLPTNGVITNGAVVFNIGTLAAGKSFISTMTVQPTTVGTNVFTSVFTSSSSSISLSTNPVVYPFDTTQMTAVNSTAMVYNPQTGLMEQTVVLSNTGTNIIDSSRVVVTGLSNLVSNGYLYNAIGTNNGNPFVQNDNTLNPGDRVEVVLEYFVPGRTNIGVPNSAYQAVPTVGTRFIPGSGTPFAITRMTNLPSGAILIEFPSTLNSTYMIIYSDNPAMTNAYAAAPDVVATADRTQWIDDGPPKTITAPANWPQRFYQVIKIQ